MKFLLKILCLLSLVSSFCFAELEFVGVLSSEYVKKLSPVSYEYDFLKGREFIVFKSAFGNFNTFRRISSIDTYYILDTSLSPGLYSFENEYFLVEGVYKTGLFSFHSSIRDYDFYYFGGGDSHSYTLAYSLTLDWGVDCKTSENFNIGSRSCSPACPVGQSWDYDNGICYSDCSDKNLNKFGYSNGTAQGGCVDCSNAFSNYDIASCVCAGFGTSMGESFVFLNPDGPFVSTSCVDGSSITFKKRSNENPDKDKEKDKNENGDKDKPKGEDNNSTNNNSGGTPGNGSSGGGGSGVGGTSGNGSSGGGGTGVETKPNPNHNGDGKEDGKGDGKQNGKGEKNAVSENLDFLDLEKDSSNFKVDYRKAIDDSFSFVNDVKSSLSDTISKIKDGNLMSLSKTSIPASCPLEYKVNLIYFEKDLIFDICKVISPVSQTLYYFFYFMFFVLFLLAVIKLFILTFMGW